MNAESPLQVNTTVTHDNLSVSPDTCAADGGRLTLRKSAKLRHRSLVEGVFASGKTIYDFPLRATWRVLDEEELRSHFRDAIPDLIGPLQMLITVPKKKRRHAVDRVLMRRRIREAFRLHNLRLRARLAEDPAIRTLSVAFIYLHNENMDYAEVERKMIKLLKKIERKIWPENDSTHPAD